MSDMDKFVNNRNFQANNKEFNAATVGDYTISTSSGIDSATTKYYNLTSPSGAGRTALGFVLRPSATVGIVSVGNKTFDNPITVTVDGYTWTTHIWDFTSMVIRVQSTNTMIRLLLL